MIVEQALEAAAPEIRVVKIVWKFAPFVAIALLIGAVFWLRGDLAKSNAKYDEAKTQVDTLQFVNDNNAKLMQSMVDRQIDNDKIAKAVEAAVAASNKATNASREKLKGMQNEPGVRDWFNEPVPSSVQGALSAPSADTIQDGSR